VYVYATAVSECECGCICVHRSRTLEALSWCYIITLDTVINIIDVLIIEPRFRRGIPLWICGWNL